MTLADLLADPSRVSDVEPGAVATLLATLAGLQLALAARLGAHAAELEPSTNGDRLMTVQEVADLVRQDRAWVWRRSRRADWKRFTVRPSRKVLLVRERGLRRWLAAQDAG